MISIIIPAFNEEAAIGNIVSYLKECSAKSEIPIEIIVVDGGSDDKTIDVARKNGALVWSSPEKGRARQMNYGAKKAQGDCLYFLHADTKPPASFLKDIKRKTDNSYECGCFLLSFDDPHPLLKFYAGFTRFNVDVFRFGDQSLFVKKALFWKVNGFNENLLVMEDQEVVSRLKNHAQFTIIKKPVITSARKYQQFGVFRLQLIFSIIVVLFYLKISQEVIAHFYKNFIMGASY